MIVSPTSQTSFMQHGHHSDADKCLWNMYLLEVSSVEDTDEDIDRALWAMKAAKDRRDEFYDRAREDNIFWQEIKRDWSYGKSTSKTQSPPWTNP